MLDLLMLLIALGCGVYALLSKDMFASVIALGAVGIAATAYFFILQAPDVAIAQAAVGGGFIPLVYVIAISKTKRREE